MKKQKLINLNLYKKEKNPIRNLRNKILEYLGDFVFEIDTIEDFAYESLKAIYPLNKSLINNTTSIEKACKKFFKILPIREGKLFEFNTDGGFKEIISNTEEVSPVEYFLRYYLQFETSPGITYKQIQEDVRKDMIKINDLIKWYEAQDFIQEHLTKRSIPRNHEERILFDFYNRCIKEQRVINEYYLTGIKKRAIAKANYWGSAIKNMMNYAESFRDRPYHFAHYFSYSYFDYRKLDLIANKVFDYPYSESEKLEKLYFINKPTFYRLLFNKSKPSELLHEIQFNLSRLPLQNNRKPIFDELEILFKRKKWIGYYSLALTQIEGLFSEMYSILNPNGHPNTKSLPDKVQYARAFHDMSIHYFDYYQYHIPRLRNKFMHSGFDEDFKLKSYDLIFDLRYLVRIFYELNNPLVKITKIHSRKKFEDFVTYEEYANYFELLNGLTKKQRIAFNNEIKLFESDFLIPYCNAEYVCIEIAQGLPAEIDNFVAEFDQKIISENKSFSFTNRNFSNLKNLIEGDKELFELISDCYLYKRRETEALLSYHVFLSNFKKYLPSLNKEYLKILNDLVSKYGIILENIYKVKELCRLIN